MLLVGAKDVFGGLCTVFAGGHNELVTQNVTAISVSPFLHLVTYYDQHSGLLP